MGGILTCAAMTFSANAQIKISSELSKIDSSDVAYIMSGDKQVGIIAHELLSVRKEGDKAQRTFIVYLAKGNEVDFSKGYTLDGGTVQWTYENNIVTEYKYVPGDKKQIYITEAGELSEEELPNAKNATFKAITLEDKRNEEVNSYPIVKIGERFWMKKNLAALHYNDGNLIDKYTTQKEWMKLQTPACAVFKNDAKSDEKENIKNYGVLYNFYAAKSDSIAPKGWFVPSDNDFCKMIAYVDNSYNNEAPNGQEAISAGSMLRATHGWRTEYLSTTDAYPVEANDLSGFSAIGSGSTSDSKYFEFSGDDKQAYFWTKTPYEEDQAMMRRFYWDSAVSNRWFWKMYTGMSIRCFTELSTYKTLAGEVTSAQNIEEGFGVKVIDNKLTIVSPSTAQVAIFDMNGTMIYNGTMNNGQSIDLPEGNNLVVKAIVNGQTIIQKIAL